MAIFQIVNGKCHWRTPFSSLDETKGKFPPDCLFVDAPDYVNEQWGFDDTEIGDDRFIKPVPPEGWIYDDESGQMMPEDMAETRLQEAQESKQASNNAEFAKWLEEHPITWTDGKQYGVTMEDQQEISLNLMSYDMACQAALAALPETATDEEKAAAVAGITLEWHAIHEACTPWTQENLVALSLAIRQYIYPGYTLNQGYKTSIYAATTKKEVEDIDLDYEHLVVLEDGMHAEYQPATEEEETDETDSTDATETAETASEDATVTETNQVAHATTVAADDASETAEAVTATVTPTAAVSE